MFQCLLYVVDQQDLPALKTDYLKRYQAHMMALLMRMGAALCLHFFDILPKTHHNAGQSIVVCLKAFGQSLLPLKSD